MNPQRFLKVLAVLACAAWMSPTLRSQVSSGGEVAASAAVFDFTNAGQTIPARKLAADPATCSIGEQYFNTALGALKVCTAANTWTSYAPTGGSVTSVGLSAPNNVFTITGSPVTATGTLALTPAGTSGGIPYFSAASSMASSALLSVNGVVVGGGTGASPKTTGVTVDSANNISTAGAITTGVGGSGHGKLALQELPSNGSTAVGWEAPDAITSSLSLVYPNASPTANSFMLFPAASGGQSQFAWTTFSSTNLTDTANLIRGNQSNTYATGNQNFSAATALEVPVASGLATTVNGQIGYESSGNLLHAAINSTDSVITTRSTATPVAGNCVKWGANGELADQGSTCSGATAASFTVTNEGATGTGLNLLTKLGGAPSTAIKPATTDTAGAVGICTGGCGTTGSATVTYAGIAGCVFDGATTAGDYVQISSATAGFCHDTGAAYPASNQVIGRVLSANGSGGTYNILLFPPEIKANGGGRLAACLDPTKAECVKETFTRGNGSGVGELTWNFASGSGGTETSTLIAGHPGVMTLQSGTTSGGLSQLNTPGIGTNQGMAGIATDLFDNLWIARIQQSDANTVARIGLMNNTNSGQPINGCYFERLGADSDWFAVCRSASVQTRTDTAVATNTSWHEFRIYSAAAGTISFSIDGSSPVAVSTNVPSVAGQLFCVITNNSTTNNEALDLDYVDVIVSGLSR